MRKWFTGLIGVVRQIVAADPLKDDIFLFGNRPQSLVELIYYTQLSSILLSDVLCLDETPIKAGRKEGKLHQEYSWPVYRYKDEIASPYSPR